MLLILGACLCGGYGQRTILACAPRDPSGPTFPRTDRHEDAVAQPFDALIAQLDAEDFAVRNDASRQLATKGPSAIPHLVAALGDESREVRFRVQGLLIHHFMFDDLVPPLIQAIGQPFGTAVRTILRDRALRQIEEAAEMQFAQKLFEFWGTDVEEFRRRVMFNLIDAPGPKEIAAVVDPLVGLRTKSLQFQDLLTRLDGLSLPYDHRHSAGYVVAETLAAGLRANDAVKVRFAERYVAAFEGLSRDLQAQGLSRSAIRKEIADRANMSDGAVVYVVQFLDPAVPAKSVVVERISLMPESLVEELFRGLSTPDAKECYRCVGKVHIVDMLDELLASWPGAPRDGVVQNLIEGIRAVVATGDKPKALVLLDALEACRELSKHQLDCREGLGAQLAHRLYLAAMVSPNTREYHPVRSVHDRIVRLLSLHVTPDQVAFPQSFLQSYLESKREPTDEEQRAALTHYVSTIEQLTQAQVRLDQPGTTRFLTLMRDNLAANRELVADGAREVSRLVRPVADVAHANDAHSPLDRSGLDRELGVWADQRVAVR
ncbi:MAG: hypothetical protein ACYC6N_15380 [Pirellulaceae bacterium]